MGAKEEFAEVLTLALQELGFRRRGDNWRRQGATLYSIVNLQPSRWDSLFYVNVGFSLADRAVRGWLPESKCMVRFRIEAIKKISSQDLRLLSDDALSTMGEQEWRAAVSDKLVGPIAGILEGATDLVGLKSLLRTNVSERAMVNAEMRGLLESSASET